MTRYHLEPVGIVQLSPKGFVLKLDPQHRAALKGLEGFSHIDVLFWCHHLDSEEFRDVSMCERPYKKGPDEIGVFATRAPGRPNPIGLTPVQVLSMDIDKGEIVVAFIDALDGSPILDIKPYLPAMERIRNVEVPSWCRHWPAWYEDSATFDWASEFENAH